MKRAIDLNKKIAIVLLLIMTLVFAFPYSSIADEGDEETSEESSESEAEEPSTQDKLDNAEEQAEEARTEKAEMMAELEVKQEELDQINYEVDLLQNGIDAKQAEIEDMEYRIEVMQYNISEQKGGLGNRLRNMYKSGSVGVFDVLLDSENFADFLTNLSLVQRIYDSDQQTLEELEEKHRALEEILAELQMAKAYLDSEMVDLETKKEQAEAAKAEVEEIISEIQSRIEEYEAEAERLAAVLEEERAELMRQLAAASAEDELYINFSGFSDTGFIWPCYGPLTSYFGYRESPGGIGSTNHGGIDIGASTGTPIYAAKSGVVSSATGWSGGYGYAVYLIHDEGFSTVYGHNSEILVGAGEFVEQGQIIAYAGSTGWSTGPHCHFEVRVGGVQVDPLSYLP